MSKKNSHKWRVSNSMSIDHGLIHGSVDKSTDNHCHDRSNKLNITEFNLHVLSKE